MPTIDNSMTVGVFKDKAQAQEALTSLKSANFDRVQFLEPDHPVHQSGGLFSSIKRLFVGDNEEGIIGNLKETGISEIDARYYQQEYEAGRIIITVKANDRKQEALDILRRYGAYDAFTRNIQAPTEAEETVSPGQTSQATAAATTATSTSSSPEVISTETAESFSAPASADPSPETTASSPASPSEEAPAIQQGSDEESNIPLTPPTDDMTDVYARQRLDLNEEQLDVSKRPVQTGQVELHKEVVTEQKSVDVPVTHEEVVLERHPVSDPTDSTAPIGQDEEIRVPVKEEHVKVTKTPVITGEASIEKRPVQEQQRVTDTVKREKLHVEQAGDAPIHGTPSDRFHPKKRQSSTGKPHARSKKRR